MAFRDGDRVDPAGVMPGLAAGFSDADIDILSRYFSALQELRGSGNELARKENPD
jgi:cytochrome c553